MSAPPAPNATRHIIGVVTPLGSFGLHTRQDGWMLGFHVNPWRVLGEPTQFTELRVTKPMTEAQVEGAKAALQATSVVTFSIRKLEPTDHGTHTATLDVLSQLSVPDPELEAAATELRVPVQLDTETLGTLRLDRRIDLFEGEIDYLGRRVGLSVPSLQNSAKIDDDALAVANQLRANLQSLDRKAREFASTQLLELKNDSWLDDEEDELSLQEFQQRISLTALSVEADGTISLYYDDGDIFLGHSIDVRGTIDGELLDASISG